MNFAGVWAKRLIQELPVCFHARLVFDADIFSNEDQWRLFMRVKKNFKHDLNKTELKAAWFLTSASQLLVLQLFASAVFGLYVRGVDSRRFWHTPSVCIFKFLNGSGRATRSLSPRRQPIKGRALSQPVTAIGARPLHWEDGRCCIARTERFSFFMLP